MIIRHLPDGGWIELSRRLDGITTCRLHDGLVSSDPQRDVESRRVSYLRTRDLLLARTRDLLLACAASVRECPAAYVTKTFISKARPRTEPDRSAWFPPPKCTTLLLTDGPSWGELSAAYEIRSSEGVRAFLESRRYVVSILVDAAAELATRFEPTGRLVLELLEDYDSDGVEHLLVTAKTNASPADALSKLRDFRRRWWRAHSRDLSTEVIFDVEYG